MKSTDYDSGRPIAASSATGANERICQLPIITECVILSEMIVSFNNVQTKAVFQGSFPRKLGKELCRIAYRKLVMLHAAVNVSDLRVPPGNRLESLRGKRTGQYSIRINNQWRICFRWVDGNAADVEIVDYHKG